MMHTICERSFTLQQESYSTLSDEDKEKHRLRRRNHIAKDLRTPKFKQTVVEPRSKEDEEERRLRRYGILQGYADE